MTAARSVREVRFPDASLCRSGLLTSRSPEHRRSDLGDANRRLEHTDRRLSSSAAQQSRLNLLQPEQCGFACGQQLPSVSVVLLGDADIITTALEVMR